MNEHCQSILRNSKSSLFYYILWIGNGNRTVSFLKLWSFPEGTIIDDWYHICANILEALFSRAFQSHHGMLKANSQYGDFTGFGLNIMTPLVQGNAGISKMLRAQANAGPSWSPDPQVRHWAVFNSIQKQKGSMKWKKAPLFKCDFDASLKRALKKGNEVLCKTIKVLISKSS